MVNAFSPLFIGHLDSFASITQPIGIVHVTTFNHPREPVSLKRFFFAILVILCCTVVSRHVSAETYNVLLIRVDFPIEDPDHETTSGIGLFDLRNYHTDPEVREEYTNPWDIPPHNRTYAEYHLEALKNYWNTVSEGRIDITYEVWPREQNDAYTMSKKFYKYGNSRSNEETYEKVAVLFKEAFETCKSIEGDAIDFSKFDTFMVMHAGLGRETSGGVINDIPSAYISGDDIVKYSGNPIIMDGVTLEHGIIVPEMASTNGIYGLNGIMAQMFGFRIGLPSLSNNRDGISSVGGWSLMDTGNMNYGYKTLGFVPSHPSMWSKIDLGLIEPLTVTSDTTIDIAATHIESTLPRSVKIPINDDEYLLLENRNTYSSPDSLPANITFSGGDSTGVWTSVGHYDAYVPGPGLLIWRVNESIIAANRADNTINDDTARKGITLLEADGRQDIGTILLFGDKEDTFTLSGTNELGPDTNPDSGNMWGGDSGITVTVNSDPGDVMNVTISFSNKLKGFPLSVGAESIVTASDLNSDGIDELIVSYGDSAYIYGTDGSLLGAIRVISHPPVMRLPQENKTTLASYTETYELTDQGFKGYSSVHPGDYFPKTIYLENQLVTSFNGEPSTLLTNQVTDIWDVISYNYIESLSTTDFNGSAAIPDTTRIMSLAAADDYLAGLGVDNKLYYGHLSTKTYGSTPLSSVPTDSDKTTGPLLVDLDRNSVYETVITVDKELRIYNIDGTYDGTFLPDLPVGDPAAADLDSDGFPEVVVCTEKQVYAFRTGAVRAERFPFNLPPGNPDETITSPPVIADLDEDGRLDIACATSAMRLVSFTLEGYPSSGFPKAVHGIITSSPCIFRLDSAGSIGLAYATSDGTLMAHELGVSSEDDLLQWPMFKGGPELSGAFLNESIPSEVQTTALFEAFCYPNPITGDYGTFRITPADATDCSITVYTVDGRIVFKTYRNQTDLIPGVSNEIRMKADGLASGLYIAKIETKQKTLIYKLGVLK